MRSLITGPLHWLGAVDLGADTEPDFRTTPWLGQITGQETAVEAAEEHSLVRLRSDGLISVPRQARRAHRYQISRFSTWESITRGGMYRFRLSGAALAAATGQELKPAHILSILKEASGDKVPQNVQDALQRLAAQGAEAQLTREVILHLKEPKILTELRSHPATAQLLGEVLRPNLVVVDESNWEALCNAALNAGLLISSPEGQSELSP